MYWTGSVTRPQQNPVLLFEMSLIQEFCFARVHVLIIGGHVIYNEISVNTRGELMNWLA